MINFPSAALVGLSIVLKRKLLSAMPTISIVLIIYVVQFFIRESHQHHLNNMNNQATDVEASLNGKAFLYLRAHLHFLHNVPDFLALQQEAADLTALPAIAPTI